METFVASTNRPAIDRARLLTVVLTALPLLVLVGFTFYLYPQGPNAVLTAFGFPALCFVAVVVVEIRRWVAVRRLDAPLVVTRQGLALQTPDGDLTLPWEAAAWVGLSTRGRLPMMTVSLRPEAVPGSGGVTSTLRPRAWLLARRRGVRLPLRQVVPSPDAVAAAIAHLSGGRFPSRVR